MSSTSARNNALGLLAEHLAELENRLRRSLPPAAEPSFAPPFLPRLETAARLLAGEAGDDPDGALPRLCATAISVVKLVDEEPQRLSPDLEPPLAALAARLETLLQRLDEGTALADAVEDTPWERLPDWFRGAGTPLQRLDELERDLRCAPAREWPPEQRERLRAAWRRLRAAGDRALEPGVPALPATPGAHAADWEQMSCCVLVESPFLRDRLLAKLRELGTAVRAVDDVDGALRLLTAPEATGPVFALTDNLEPSRHLERLAAFVGRENRADRRGPRPVILLAAASGPGAGDPQARARACGGHGAWTEPFAAEQLCALLNALRD